ncbi:MAG: EamA family transporter [Leptothrix sp. (in: Bacteria)]|nr:EamA family transporter [Leptothrix sp. (in: b-proteobacteria)]
MPATALMFVLAAAVLHALWNIAAKRAGGDHRFAFVSVVMTVVVWAPVAWWFGADEVPRWTALQWAAVTASAAVHVVYFLTLLRGYREADLTVVYPVARGSGPLVTAAAAVLLLGEAATGATVAGVLAVCGGVFVIAGGPGLWRRAHEPAERARLLAGLRWGGLTGMLIACYSVLDGYAVKWLLMAPVAFDYFCNLLRLPMMLPLVWGDGAGLRRVLRTQWRAALVVGALGPLAYILVLYAVTMAPLSHVAPARELSMLVAALIGGRLLGEADRGARLLGAACIAGGVMALAW